MEVRSRQQRLTPMIVHATGLIDTRVSLGYCTIVDTVLYGPIFLNKPRPNRLFGFFPEGGDLGGECVAQVNLLHPVLVGCGGSGCFSGRTRRVDSSSRCLGARICL